MRRLGIPQHGQSQQQGPNIGIGINTRLRCVFQVCNQQVVWRAFVLLVGILCAQKLRPWPKVTLRHEHMGRMLFFKLYSVDRFYNHDHNLTQYQKDENNIIASHAVFPSRRQLAEVHDLGPQFRVFGGFSHTKWSREFYVKMAVGKAKKVFYFQIDTGSAPSWLHCTWPTIQEHPPHGPNGMYIPEKHQQIDCRLPECKRLQGIPVDRTHPFFPCDAKNEWQCIHDITYYDNSNYRGLFVEDVVTFETPEGHELQAPISWICSWHITLLGHYEEEYMKKWPLTSDGLIGLNKDHVSFISQLRSQKVISSNTLGHCFRSLDTSDFQKDSGFMFFGKSKLLYTLEIAWTPMVLPSETMNNGLYEIYMKSIKLGQLSLKMTNKSCMMIIDCGSTRSYIIQSYYKPIKDAVIKQADLKGYTKFQGPIPTNILDIVNVEDLDCWCIPENGVPETDFETIHIELRELDPHKLKAILNLKPEQYLIWKGCVVDDCKLLCFNLAKEEKESSRVVLSIGGLALQGYLVVLDTEENRVGWMESDCNEDEFLKLYRNALV